MILFLFSFDKGNYLNILCIRQEFIRFRYLDISSKI